MKIPRMSIGRTMEHPRSLTHHNDEIIKDIDNSLANYHAIDTQAHIEAEAWAEMDAAIQEGYISREEGEEAYFRWFRLERGLPPLE